MDTFVKPIEADDIALPDTRAETLPEAINQAAPMSPESAAVVQESPVKAVSDQPLDPSLDSDRSVLENRGKNEGVLEQFNVFNPDSAIRLGVDQNTAKTWYDDISRKVENPPDVAWLQNQGQQRDQWIKDNKVAPEDVAAFAGTSSKGEADARLLDLRDREQTAAKLQFKYGLSPVIASMLPLVLDIDAVPTLMTGGLGVGLKAARFGRIFLRGGETAASQGLNQYIHESLSTKPEWSAVPLAAGMGLLMGGALGGLSKAPAPKRLPGAAELAPDLEARPAPPEATLGPSGEVPRNGRRKLTPDTEEEFPQTELTGDELIMKHNQTVSDTFKKFSDELDDQGAVVTKNDPDESPVMHEDPYHSLGNEIDAERAKIEAEEQAAKEAAQAPEGAKKPAPEEEPPMSPSDVEPQHTFEGLPIYKPGDTVPGAGGLGAAAKGSQSGLVTPEEKTLAAISKKSQDWANKTGILNDASTRWSNSPLAKKFPGLARAAQGMEDIIDRTMGLKTDASKLMAANLPTAAKLMYDLLESPSGIIRNNKSAAMILDNYQKQLLGPFMDVYSTSYKAWSDMRGHSMMDRATRLDIQKEFNEDLTREMNGRYHDGTGHVPTQDPHIKAAADALDAMHEREIGILQGDKKTNFVKGSEKLQAKSGYMAQRWSGRNIDQMIRSKRYTLKEIEDAIAESYVTLHNFSKSDASTYAKAAVRRARSVNDGMSTNLVGVLQLEGRDYLKKVLTDNGATEAKAEKLIKKLEGHVDERGKAGHFKERISIDMRHVSGNGVRLIDLFDIDHARSAQRRMRGSAGSAALARKGIRSASDRDNIIKTILAEQRQRNGDASMAPTGNIVSDTLDKLENRSVPITETDINDIFRSFSSSAGILGDGKVDPALGRMMKLTQLSTLSGMAFSQLAEVAGSIASVGWHNWTKFAGDELMNTLKDKQSPLMQELKHAAVYVPEEGMNRPDLWNEYDSGVAELSHVMNGLDRGLAIGQRIQGVISGFYQVKNIQTRIALSSMTDKIMKHLRGDDVGLSDARLFDMGLHTDANFSPASFTAIRKYLKNGTIEFDPKTGNLVKLNLDKWNPSVKEDFTYALNRNVNQLVQQAMAGESNSFFHRNGIAAMFMQLKQFPMLAIRKQFLRNARLADAEAAQTFLYGLGAAGMMYSVKNALYGNNDKNTAEGIVRGAIGMSNITGWIPMFVDPLAYMTGADSLRMSGYQKIGTGALGLPAAVNVMQNYTALPRAAVHGIGQPLGLSRMSNQDKNALKSIPILGTMVGFATAVNLSKDDGRHKATEFEKVMSKPWAGQPGIPDVNGPDPQEPEPEKATKPPKADKPQDVIADALAASSKESGGLIGMLN